MRASREFGSGRSTGTCSGSRAWWGRCCTRREADGRSARATGIGCFFDDPVHDVFGLADHAFQSLYHFTIGMPVEDARLAEPGYPWA